MDPIPEALRPRHLWRRVAQLTAVAAVVAIAIATLPDLGSLREHFDDARASWLALAAAAEVGSALSYGAVLRAVFCPSMRWRLSYNLALSELAADALLPAGGAGGLALGAWTLHQAGMTSGHIARRTVAFFLVTSAANLAVVILAGAGVAAGVLPAHASLPFGLVPAVAAAVAVLFVTVALPRLLDRAAGAAAHERRAGGLRARVAGRVRLLGQEGALTLAAGVREAVALLRSGEPLAIAGSVGYMAFDMATLAAAFPATGSPVPGLGTLMLGYTIGQLGGLIPVPGGLGAVGGGLIGAFMAYGAPLAPVTAAVVVYRAFQLGVPAALGAPSFMLLHRTLRRHEMRVALCQPLAEERASA